MTAYIRHITVDCADPYLLSRFWSEVTGYREDPADPNLPGHTEALILAPDGGPGLLFVTVPETKAAKNRVHLDVAPSSRTRDEEVAHLREVGATVVDDRRLPDGRGWVVLADPEGNEFCVERGAAERAATAPTVN